MKTKTTTLFLLGALAISAQVKADDLLFESQRALQFDSEQIDIDGKPRDRLNEARRRLERQNEQMVQKRIEDQRIKQERELARQLQKAFTQGLDARDEVRTTMAAVEPVVEAPAPAPKVEREEKPNKVLPYFGVTNIKGEKIDFETKINAGLALESMVTRNISVGVGLGYNQMDITDYSNSFVSNPAMYNVYPVYNPGYYQAFGQGRNIDYKNLEMSVNSKFFLTTESKIRPYLGAALSYNRSKLTYTDNGNNYLYNNVNFGNEGYSTNYIGATGTIGSEVIFTDTFGMNLDFRYHRGLTSGFSSDSEADAFRNPDQLRLENIGKAIESADFFSLNLGVVIRF